jgi:hypothetical protein
LRLAQRFDRARAFDPESTKPPLEANVPQHVGEQIAPGRIVFLDQLDLLLAPPSFHGVLAPGGDPRVLVSLAPRSARASYAQSAPAGVFAAPQGNASENVATAHKRISSEWRLPSSLS